MKLSLITTDKDVPLNVDLYKGNLNDITILNVQLDKLDTSNFDKNKVIFMADKGYDSSILRNKLSNYFYKIIIPYNKRNTKVINKIKILSNDDKILYKKRITIENTFLKIKKHRRLEIVYEKHFKNFISFIYLSLIKLVI